MPFLLTDNLKRYCWAIRQEYHKQNCCFCIQERYLSSFSPSPYCHTSHLSFRGLQYPHTQNHNHIPLRLLFLFFHGTTALLSPQHSASPHTVSHHPSAQYIFS